MEAPGNLVDAVNRLMPRAILLLDTNTIMNNPRLDSYEISASGRFLLAIPQVVYNEIMGLRLGNKDEQTRQKASRALNLMDKLYERGDPAAGIDLGNDRWLITAKAPSRQQDSNSVEDEQVRRNLGKVDDALLRLAAASSQDCPDTSTLLITRDRDLTRVSRSQGLSACPLSSLRSSETLEQMLPDVQPSEAPTIDLSSLLSPEQERPVKIAMKLEELRSEREYLVASGSGFLRYDEERHPFRWIFPYKNLAVYREIWNEDILQLEDDIIMPMDNLDFMGADEQIPESVRRLICDMLERSAGWTGYGGWSYRHWALQSPLTQVRFDLKFHADMGGMRGGLWHTGAEIHKRDLGSEAAAKFDKLSIQHDRHMQSLLDGTAKSFGDTYRSAFRLGEAIDGVLGDEGPYQYDDLFWDLESSLISFVDYALDTWSVGETQEAEFNYRPFEWLEDKEEEAVVDDGEEAGEA